MSLAIWGVGTALPKDSVTQQRAAELINHVSGYDAERSLWIESLYRGAGVDQRHMIMLEHLDEILSSPGGPLYPTGWRMGRYDEAVRPLSLEASSLALASAGVEPGEITHLVTVSCTGFAAPGFDLALFDGLGLDPGVQRTHVGFMGCHGALNGLRVANAFASADDSACVLVCAAELPSLHIRFEQDPRLSVVNALFADGAAAVVGRAAAPSPPNDRNCWRLAASGSALVPDTADAMSWRIGDKGFEMTLSPKVAGHIVENLRPWLDGWLWRRDLVVADIASWAIHPGGPRILDAVETALELPASATSVSREVLATCGNMSSPTVLFVLDRLRRRRAPRPCVSLAFGPGLAIEVALFE
jgi:predicted naringenin-chalcone synthase